MSILYRLRRSLVREKKELISTLDKYLEPDEKVEFYVIGKVGPGEFFSPQCILLLTNKKLIRYSSMLWNEGVVYIPVESITLIDEVKNFSRRMFVFYFPSGAVPFFPSYRTDEEGLKILLDALKKRMEQANNKQAGSAADGIPEQIRKLAALAEDGILTRQEFEDKKKELLSRM
jgi:hypothetical protein